MTSKADLNDARWQMQTARVLEEVRMERDRQRVGEGYSRAHDDRYRSGELARAGAGHAYVAALDEHVRQRFVEDSGSHARSVFGSLWPWPFGVFKLKPDPRRGLIIACAFIVAEIEKIDRMRERAQGRG